MQIFGKAGQQVSIVSCSGTQNLVIPSLPFPLAGSNNYSFLWYDNPACAGAEANGEANLVITSAQPIAVVQIQKAYGTDCTQSQGCLNDPESVIVYPTNMWESNYLTSTLADVRLAFIVLVVPNTSDAMNNTLVDGVAPSGGTWQPFANGQYAFYRHDVTLAAITGANRTHRLQNTKSIPFGFYVLGESTAGSYIIQGGGLHLKIWCFL